MRTGAAARDALARATAGDRDEQRLAAGLTRPSPGFPVQGPVQVRLRMAGYACG